MARLGQAHRATADIDTVVDALRIQATEPIAPRDLDGLTSKQILHVGAHRYALE